MDIDEIELDLNNGGGAEAEAETTSSARAEARKRQDAGVDDADADAPPDAHCAAERSTGPPRRPPAYSDISGADPPPCEADGALEPACGQDLSLSLKGSLKADGDEGRLTASRREPELTNSMLGHSGLDDVHSHHAGLALLPGPGLQGTPSGLADLLSHHDAAGREELAPAARREEGWGAGGVEVIVREEDPAATRLLKEKMDALNAAGRPNAWLDLDGDYLDDDIGSEIERFSREELLQVIAVSKLPWGSDPLKFKCPYCQIEGYSANHWEHTCFNYVFSALLCVSGCCLGCCLVPMCTDWLKNTKHVCTNCHRVVGYRRACALFHDRKHAVCCCGLFLCVVGDGLIALCW